MARYSDDHVCESGTYGITFQDNSEAAPCYRDIENFQLEQDRNERQLSWAQSRRFFRLLLERFPSMFFHIGPLERQGEARSSLPMLKSIRTVRRLSHLMIACFSILGLFVAIENLLSFLAPYSPDNIEWILDHWNQPGQLSESLIHWPADASADLIPIPCHSHNDYWRPVPLFTAVASGCTSVEADVWLVDDELYVGHTRMSLTSDRTLRNLYLEPLLKLLQKQNPPQPIFNEDVNREGSHTLSPNGVFDSYPKRALVLLIDFKSDGSALWSKVSSQLSPLRDLGYLTYFNGTAVVESAVTIVVTGNAPFDLITANRTYRDVFFDAPLEDLADLSEQWPNPNRIQSSTRVDGLGRGDLDGRHPSSLDKSDGSNVEDRQHYHERFAYNTSDDLVRETYNRFNSFYASVSFTESIGRVWGSRLTQKQLQLIRGQIRGAHRSGLKVRYWGTPQWPIGLRNHIWHILVREGVDILNVDDLYGATWTDWRRRRSRFSWPS